MSKQKKYPAFSPLPPPPVEKPAGALLFRLGQQAAVLLLAVLGFLFCLLTSYRLDLPVSTLVWTVAAFSLLSLAVFSIRRYGIVALVFLAAALFWIWYRSDYLLQGILLLFERAAAQLSLQLPESLQRLLQPVGVEDAVLYMTRALQTILFFVSFLSGYFVVANASAAGLALATLPLLLPAPFYQLSPSIPAFFTLLGAHLMLYAFNNGKRALSMQRTGAYVPQSRRRADQSARRTAQQTLSLLALPLIVIAALLSGVVLPQKGYERPALIETLRQKIFSLDIGKEAFWKSNDGLTRGDFKSLSSIRFTGDTAIQVRVSRRLSLYLRDYAGSVYTSDGWTSVSQADFSALASNVSGIAPQNLLARAAAAGGDAVSTFELSVRNIDATPFSIWAPPGLVTRAEELSNAGYIQDTSLAFATSAGSEEYTLAAVPVGMALYSVAGIGDDADADVVRRAYGNAAGAAYGLDNAGGDDAELVRQAADAYIDYVLNVYTALPAETLAAAERLCGVYGLQREIENGSLNLAATCQAVHALLSERCVYAYAPPSLPEGEDFTTYFLEESRSGYCVHFATAATVLLRSLGIPARYAEGYIVIQSDYDKPADAEGFVDIEDTHAHAWVEVFDPAQLEWIPVEMTTSTTAGTQPTPDENGEEAGEPTFSLTEPTPTATPEPTPTPAPEPTPTPASSTLDNGSTPEPTTDAAALPEITPTPMPTENGADEGADDSPAAETETEGETASSVRPPLWPVFVILAAIGLPLSVFIWRKATYEKRVRAFSQKDMNAAVLAVCRYALDMLAFAGAPAMQPTQTPETYADSVSRTLPFVDRALLESMLLSAQRARFSDKVCPKRERDEAVLFQRSLASILPSRLKRVRCWIFRWRFPPV